MKLYVCWGTFLPSLHNCGRAHRALRRAGHNPEVIRVYGSARVPGLDATSGRDEVEEVSGQREVPVLVLNDGEVIVGSYEIADWAHENRLSWVDRLNAAGWLRWGLALMFVVDGADKFFNLLTYWPLYLAPWIADLSPFSVTATLGILGVIEILVGLLVAFRPRLGLILSAFLLWGITLNLVAGNLFFNIALIDAMLGLAALMLAQRFRKRSR